MMNDGFTFNTVGLLTRDNRAAVDFYTKTFGFTIDWDGVQPDVHLRLGDRSIDLFPCDAFERLVSRKLDFPGGLNGSMMLGFEVPSYADVVKGYRHALECGGVSILPPTAQPWGQRTCYVAGPGGNLIEIGSFND